MKLTFFLIGFCLIFLQVYYKWDRKNNPGPPGGSITISSESLKEVIKWSGVVQLTNDESAIAHMDPGGYFRFRMNEKRFEAKGDLQGEIHYEMEDGSGQPMSADSSRRFQQYVLQEAIAWGFFGQDRAERIFATGGAEALLSAMSRLKNNEAKLPYLDILFQQKALTRNELLSALKQVNQMGNDYHAALYLKQFNLQQLADSSIWQPWLQAVRQLGADYHRIELLRHFIKQMPLTDSMFREVLSLNSELGADNDKKNLLAELLHQSAPDSTRFHQLLKAGMQLGNDHDKQELLHQLMEVPGLQTPEWISLIQASGQMSSDYDKSNLLLALANILPQNDSTVSAYREVAKTIGNDTDYGRAMRALE